MKESEEDASFGTKRLLFVIKCLFLDEIICTLPHSFGFNKGIVS